MKLRKLNKKGQISSIVYFAGAVIVLLMLAPILLKLVITPTNKMMTSFASIDASNKSVVAMNYAQSKFTGMFDWMLAFLLIFNIVILLITAFLVDIHPAFFVIYLIAVFFLVIFAPSILEAVTAIWDNAQFSGVGENNVVKYLPIMEFVKNNYIWVIMGAIVLSGLIMYGKYKFGSGGSATGNYY